jgi:hypothetical protein
VALFHALPCFPILILSSLHLMIFKYPYFTHMKSNFRIFSAMDSTLYFLHIYRLDSQLKKNILPSNFEKILWSSKFLKVLPCRNNSIWKSRWHFHIMRPWALNLDNLPILSLWHIVGLSTKFLLNFKTLTTIWALHQKNFFFPFNCYNLAIRAVTLNEIFFTNY